MESLTSESLSKNRQALVSIVDPPSGEVSSRVPPALGSLSKDPKPAEDLTVIPPVREAPSKTAPTRESSTLPQLKGPSGDQPMT